MSDISTIWQSTKGDWLLSGSSLASGNDLVSAIIISLFTDRVAETDDVIPDGSGNPRGWWADDPLAPIGSRLWLLERAKRTQETLQRAKDYTTEALQWLINDGVVATFGILVEWQAQHTLGVQVIAYQTNGDTTPMNFAWAWPPLA